MYIVKGGESVSLYCGLSYDEVVSKYAQTVHSACVMRLSGHCDADDCFQNTFVRLYTSSPEFRDEEHLKAWLLHVAVNECRKYLRDNRRELSLDSVVELPVDTDDDAADISWAILRLEPKYREVLYLYYAEGYKTDEIAEILSRNPATVRTMLRRGRMKLKKIYGGDDDA